VFSDRWSLLVLRDIVFGDRRYFRELQAGSEEGIASNILADRLKRLVQLGLLTREDTRAGQRARYSLTEPAIQLVPVFAQLGSWGLRHRPTSRALRVRAELLEQGGPALWQEFMDELRRSHLGSEIPSAITERSRAPERGLPRCYQLLVAARPSTMSKGADGRRPSCLTCEPPPAQERR
jgi:DNA-binding HxlR family transcriptional regulator